VSIVKKFAAMLMLATALVAPGVAMARDVTIEATLTPYSGPEAYLAVYVLDAEGNYNSTLWVAGHKTKYYGALRGWVAGVSSAGGVNLDGITGASVGSGETLTVHASLADALIDAGYEIHIDTAVEHGGEYIDDVVIPLSSTPASANGTGYVDSAAISF
jgi:hypothetical protein